MSKTMNYEVTITATVTKTIRVSADSEEAAEEAAHEGFSPEVDDGDEKFDQQTINIVEVT